MSRLHDVFAQARAENRSALIGYWPSGYPDHDTAIAVILAMIDGGADIIEVGLPYSDPLMDGPVIEKAVTEALAAGSTTARVIQTVSQVSQTPTLVMSYWNPIERYGVERFATDLANAGGVGVITPDITPEESRAWVEATDSHNVDRVFLVAPSSTDERLRLVTHATTGFVYAASTMGVTGTRTSVSSRAHELVARTRAVTTLPIAVGLGVSSADQAAQVASYADGVIVGSAFVRAFDDAGGGDTGVDAVRTLARELSEGVRRGRRD